MSLSQRGKSDPPVAQHLMEWWEKEESDDVKRSLAIHLGNCPSTAVVEWSCARIANERDRSLWSALAYPIMMGTRGAQPSETAQGVLTQFLRSMSDPRIQYRSLQLIGDYGSSSHLDLLRGSEAFYEDPDVRARADFAIQQIQKREAQK